MCVVASTVFLYQTLVDPTKVTIPYYMTPQQAAGVSYMAFNLQVGQPT